MSKKAFEPIITDRIENITLALTLDSRRPEELLPVAVRVNYNRKSYYHRTGYKCSLELWEKLSRANKRGELFQIKEEQNLSIIRYLNLQGLLCIQILLASIILKIN